MSLNAFSLHRMYRVAKSWKLIKVLTKRGVVKSDIGQYHETFNDVSSSESSKLNGIKFLLNFL